MFSHPVFLLLFSLSAIFTGAGVYYASRQTKTFDFFVAARNSTSGFTAMMTLVATSFGAWLIFSPAESAAYGGLPTVLGYAIGSALPMWAFIGVGKRFREQYPTGQSIPEYALRRFGIGMATFTFLCILAYLFCALCAETTGLAKIIAMYSPVSLGWTSAIVLIATLTYTLTGGLATSIFTDRLQSWIILPGVCGLSFWIFHVWQDSPATLTLLREKAPELASWTYGYGWKTAFGLIIAIPLAVLFDQSFWQRVFAAKDDRVLRFGFGTAAILCLPIVAVFGWFGLMAAAHDKADEPALAAFALLDNGSGELAVAIIGGLLILAITLVISSLDSLINGLLSMLAVQARVSDKQRRDRLALRIGRIGVLLLAIPVWYIASQGLSILKLYMAANLFCAALAFPVFSGLWGLRLRGWSALLSGFVGLVPAAWYFFTRDDYLWPFIIAFGLSATLSLLFAKFWPAESPQQTKHAPAHR